jgi:cytochrome c553
MNDDVTVVTMKTSLIIGTLLTALAAALGAAPAAASELPTAVGGNAEKGKEKANQICQACHGLDGNGVPGQPVWPKIAGQHPRYIYKQLNNFKDNERYNAQMSPMAMPLTDEEMRNLAAYYSSMEQSGGEADPDLVAKGESLYRAGNPETGVPACSGCHGPAGLGSNLAKFPRVAGQFSEYSAQTLQHFRATERANDPNGMMRGVAANLTDDEIAALAAYIEGLTQ